MVAAVNRFSGIAEDSVQPNFLWLFKVAMDAGHKNSGQREAMNSGISGNQQT
jgi:hypothetical protein